MTPEEKELLKETAELTKENNKILRSMRRSARWSAFFRLVYWLVILGGAVGTYYLIQPYINTLIKSYQDLQSGLSTVKNIPARFPVISSFLGGNNNNQ